MIEWCQLVLLPYTQDRPSALIVDQYRAHLTPRVRRFLSDHNVELIIVPANRTGVLQPLDVKIFAPLKSIMTSMWADSAAAGDSNTDTVKGLMKRFKTAYSLIDWRPIVHAFAEVGADSSLLRRT